MTSLTDKRATTTAAAAAVTRNRP
uniref:Uncharacterized protein n=1 Tax=Anopheles albimanus TaxID=7167 RepID=A0A182FXT2_ANOAL